MAETESKRGPGNEDVKFFVFRFRFFKEMSSVTFFNVDRETIFGRIIVKKEWTSGLKRDLALDF